VIIPEENRKDLVDIPKSVSQQMKLVPVRWIDEVLDLALERPVSPRPPVPVVLPEPAREAEAATAIALDVKH
jgi:ATP-dependent Lon protease